MTPDEFNTQWLPHHLSAFPSIHAWIKKFPAIAEVGKPAQPTQQGIARAWRAALASTLVGDAIMASDAIVSGDEAGPEMFDDTPRTIRAIARRLARNRAFAAPRQDDIREPTYRCPHCLDGGQVHILQPVVVRVLFAKFRSELPEDWREWCWQGMEVLDMLRTRGVHKRVFECDVKCICDRAKKWDDQPAFDPEHDCKYVEMYPESVVAWFASKQGTAVAIGSKFQDWDGN